MPQFVQVSGAYFLLKNCFIALREIPQVVEVKNDLGGNRPGGAAVFRMGRAHEQSQRIRRNAIGRTARLGRRSKVNGNRWACSRKAPGNAATVVSTSASARRRSFSKQGLMGVPC